MSTSRIREERPHHDQPRPGSSGGNSTFGGLTRSPPCSPFHVTTIGSPSPSGRGPRWTTTRPGELDVDRGDIEALLPAREWAFPKEEVLIEEGEEGVLGRGSYGEVRAASWRGLRVAAKQLHALCGGQGGSLDPQQALEVRRELLKEMQLLSRLRHPNLVLFIGVSFDSRTNAPLSIITELMSSSLYDLLETRRIRLGQTEVLDLAGDVARGLVYLHGHSPPIVHRDLSSKNVLYDGYTAKLADLGQAKAMGGGGAGGSRQTTMPGAMVYAAPEVLTGRYASSIDIFSFGVLLAQTITGQYPRLDKRRDQVLAAGARFPRLKVLLERCLSLHAEDRPTAADITKTLGGLMEDLSVYQPPGHGAGVLADRWFQSATQERVRGLEARLGVYENRLAAEMGRWRTEANRADELDGKISEAEQSRDNAMQRQRELEAGLERARSALEEARQECTATAGHLDDMRGVAEALKREVNALKDESVRRERSLKSAETLQALAEGNCAAANQKAQESETAKKLAEERAAKAEAQLAGQVIATREADTRVAQAISRWEGEKVERLRFRHDYFKKCSETQERVRELKALEERLERAESRLAKYDGLPESEQIRQRIQDIEEDRQRAAKCAEEAGRKMEGQEKDIAELQAKLGECEKERDGARALGEDHRTARVEAERDRAEMEKKAEKATRAEGRLKEQLEEEREATERAQAEASALRKNIRRMRAEAPWLFKGTPKGSDGGHGTGTDGSAKKYGALHGHASTLSSDSEEELDVPQLLKEVQDSGPKGVTELLQKHPRKRDMQWRGLRALRDLANQGDRERTAVAAAGGVVAAVKAMERFPNDVQVQVGGTKTLAHLAFGNDANRVEVGSAGGITAVLGAMRSFPGDKGLQGEACTAITNASHNCDRNRHLVVDGCGVITILDAMQNFPGDGKLQRHACWALLTLAANDEVSRIMAAEGAVGAVLAAMINCSRDTSVQHFGCWALANIAWGQEDVQKFAREEGAIQTIQAAVESFPANQALVEKAHLAVEVIAQGTTGLA